MFVMVEALKPGHWVQVHYFTRTLTGKVDELSVGEERTLLRMDNLDDYSFEDLNLNPVRSYMNGTPLLVAETRDDLEAEISKLRVMDLVKVLE